MNPSNSLPRALVILPCKQNQEKVEDQCRLFHAEIGDPGFEFLAVKAEKLPNASLDSNSFDLILLWLTRDLANDESIMDWLDDWAEKRSEGDGGTLVCLIEDEDPNWKLRLWELFTESIGAWRGIDFHCLRLRDQVPEKEFVRSATRHLRVKEGSVSPETLAQSFRLISLEDFEAGRVNSPTTSPQNGATHCCPGGKACP